MKDEYIIRFYDEIKQNIEGDYKIILEPNRDLKEDWIEYDTVEWKLEEGLEKLVNELLKKKQLSFEKKILEVYKYICLNYIYDDNVLYFFRKDTSDPENVKYIAVDWYGRVVENQWFENRQSHNRRICYEFSRLYAKAINILLENNENLEACMIGDKDNTHYVVGLTGKDYSVILDQDDFNSIKDLTRLKLGLAIKGIKILRDETGKIKEVVDKFNENKPDEIKEIEELQKNDIIEYLNNVIQIIRKYNIDSQGFMEYMRAKIEQSGIEIEKIWKEVKGGNEKRYVRCLVFDFNQKTYLLDSVEQTLTIENIEDLKKQFIFKPEENEYSYFGG